MSARKDGNPHTVLHTREAPLEKNILLPLRQRNTPLRQGQRHTTYTQPKETFPTSINYINT